MCGFLEEKHKEKNIAQVILEFTFVNEEHDPV